MTILFAQGHRLCCKDRLHFFGDLLQSADYFFEDPESYEVEVALKNAGMPHTAKIMD